MGRKTNGREIKMSVRSIFLVVRGSYQAGLALRMARGDLRELEKAQQAIVKRTEEMMRAANQWIFAGAAFTMFGTMITKTLMDIMNASTEGRRVLAQFTMVSQTTMQKLSQVLAPMLGMILQIVSAFMRFATINPIITWLIAGFLVVLAVVTTVGGVILVLGGAIMMAGTMTAMWHNKNIMLAGSLKVTQMQMTQYSGATQMVSQGSNAAAISVSNLAMAVGRAFAVFLLVYTVMSLLIGKFGLMPALIITLIGLFIALAIALWAGATAMSVLTLGAAAAVGVAAAVAASQSAPTPSMPSYSAGTSFVRQGGLALLHGGEEIKSARQATITSKQERGAGRQTMGGMGERSITTYNIPINTINTKSDIDDVDSVITRALKDKLDNKV